ncbi:MAG TPA: glutamyl-tRNA reductase [Tepidisphaeraceae bacterium]|jgi:glutamyl-tRNA reductase
MDRLLLLGMNHATAPLAVRERLAVAEARQAHAISQFQQRFPESEIVLLSTCNRIEIYTVAKGQAETEEIAKFLPDFHGLAAGDFDSHWYRKTEKEVAQHLFTVTASLDSIVLGETQIIGQVRDAYELARTSGSAGPLLHPLFQKALAVGRQVMTQTALGAGRLSIASTAVDYAKSIFDRFGDKTVLCIGAGKMARLVISHFHNLRPGRLLICNRDQTKAEALAAEFNGKAVSFMELTSHLAHADIVITSTGATQPIITRTMFESVLKLRRYRPIFIVDIAVPRDVENSVGQLEHVYLYNIDDLQQVVSATQSQRSGEIESARALVRAAVEEFAAWHRNRQMGPAIEQLYARYHGLAQEELARITNRYPDMPTEQRQQLEEMVRRIVNKLLHDPIQTLKNADAQHAPISQYLHAMNKLFHLDEGDGKSA